MRPLLNETTDADIFMSYYWLKTELIDFCRKYSLPSYGSKKEITYRIYRFLNTGEKLKNNKYTSGSNVKTAKYDCNDVITLNDKIRCGYKNDERHRKFFISVIGSHFRFNLPFMKWMKNNAGKTYQEAVDEWVRIYNEKKAGKKYDISPQFEYNRYTRDFFLANPGKDRESAIKCWKYKKSLPGHNRYEDSDLAALK